MPTPFSASTFSAATRRQLGTWLATAALAAALPAGAWAQAPAAAALPKVRLTTSLGDIVLELNADKAPKTVDNFLQYVRDKHYDGTVFHRVINGFMIQGGGFDTSYKQKTTRAPIALEVHPSLKNNRGTIAMARTGNPNSATSQFFINVVDNANLNAPMPDGYGYTVFGQVVAGMDVVDKIRNVSTGAGGPFPTDVPKTPITILKATLEK